MKKILITLSLLTTLSLANAHEGFRHYGYRGPCCGYGGSWVTPALIGGVIGYEIARPRQPDVVVVQPQPVYPPPAAPYWPQPADYHWEAILDANCNCYRTVLVHN